MTFFEIILFLIIENLSHYDIINIQRNFFLQIRSKKVKVRGGTMAGLSNSIESFLKELLSQTEDGILEIGRNDLASQFNCAPSQINYVLTTRFTPYKGYYIESRRGGSGYIKITKLAFSEVGYIDELINDVIGTSITKDKANSIVNSLYEEEVLTKREGRLIIHALEDTALTNVDNNIRNVVRADLLRNMLLAFLR